MIAAVFALATAQDAVDFKLGWKKDQTFAYDLDVKGFGEAQGRMQLTVTATDDKSVTLSWPEVKFSGNFRPLPGGTQKLTLRGVLTAPVADGALYFLAMALPEKPTKLGEKFVTRFAIPNGTVELTSTFTKIDGTKASLSSSGKMNVGGQSANVKTESVFDTSRGIFLSGKTDMMDGATVFTFKLVEKP